MKDKELIKDARAARASAYARYSRYAVGAALHTNAGVFTGANIEVSGRSTSVHAEMMAAYNAILGGATAFYTIAVSPQDQSGEAICGLCQHTLAEFTEELRIIEDCGESPPTEYMLSDLIGPAYRPSTRHGKR